MKTRKLYRVWVAGSAVSCAPIEVTRLDVDDAGEPRVLEGTALIVGREPQLAVAHG